MSALEQLTKIPLRNKLILLVFLAGLVGVGYYFLGYGPTADKLVSLQKKEIKLEKDLKEAEKKKSTYLADQQRRDDLRKSYAQQLRALPPETEMSSFLNSLNKQAEMVGLEILSVKPLAEEPGEYYARIPVELKLAGAYHQLTKFFYLVGNLERVINIEDISVASDKATETGVVLKATVLATTFRSLKEGGESEGKGKGKGHGKKKSKKKKKKH